MRYERQLKSDEEKKKKGLFLSLSLSDKVQNTQTKTTVFFD